MNQSFIILICSLFFFSINNVYGYLGINWSRLATQRLLPSMVVDLLLQNGIHEVKLFNAGKNLLPALAGTNIGITVSVPNDDLPDIDNVESAKNWIKTKLIDPYVNQSLLIRYISIGTKPLAKKNFMKCQNAVEVLDYFQTAIDELNFGNGTVKATMDHFVDEMKSVKKPSEAIFNEDVRDAIIRSTQILVKNNAPIFLDMVPIYTAIVGFNDTEFSYFENNSTTKGLTDEGYTYNNVFELVYDMFVCALEKEGFKDIKFGIGQVGWPTDGIAGANAKNAERFNQGLINYIRSGKGTPRRPVGPIDAYLHNLADENMLDLIINGERRGFIRHWGIYRFDGKPKYHLDFTGQGRDVYPYSAKGVTHMPNRWCVYNHKSNDTTQLSRLLLDACSKADCTSIENGGTCGKLTFLEQVSYAFNMLFQEKSQKITDQGCYFEGLGKITTDDPSKGTCTFPVEILSNEFANRSNTLIFAPATTWLCMILYIILTWYF